MPVDLHHRPSGPLDVSPGPSSGFRSKSPATTTPPFKTINQTTGDGSPDERLDDLGQIISAYNLVTENLRRSHDALREEVAQLQQQLASTDAQLQRSKRLAALGEMAAGIAHEIRNPLGAIQLYAGILVEDLQALSSTSMPHQPLLDAARQIAVGVRGLDAIVSDVLSFAREIDPHLTPVSASRLFDRAILASQPAIDAAGIVVNRDPRMSCDDNERGFTVLADANLLHQALLNLIRNAVDSMAEHHPRTREVKSTALRSSAQADCPRTRQKTPSPTAACGMGVLTLTARTEDAHVILSVRDTGPGIADETIDRIFNPFFTTRNTGTGLGLAIVHRIIDAHQGAIRVHNDHGAVFELLLPSATRGHFQNRKAQPVHGSPR